jgi:hypothetical protein
VARVGGRVRARAPCGWDQGIDLGDPVTDAESADFVPEMDRIAVFDNDGTLWTERPAIGRGRLIDAAPCTQ